MAETERQGAGNPLTITALILSLCGTALCCCVGVGIPFAVGGAVVGHVALRRGVTAKSGSRTKAVIAIVVGWTFAVLGVAVLYQWVDFLRTGHVPASLTCFFLPCGPER